ncbi:myosin-2 heavy chain isoform X1 [Dermacentor albipictus]|uniref:myosin-2 heavy chain isoform X1 n=1 Tax=Dermacentor albipictus TaxID=60249 RepID=UPI0031FC2B79
MGGGCASSPRAHAARAAVATARRRERHLNSVSQNSWFLCTTSTMYRRSKSCREVPERTLTRSDIFKLVQGIRTRKHRKTAAADELSDKSEESRSQEPSSEHLESKETRSGVNVCIFPCNNPIEHVIAECYKHVNHGRRLSTGNSHSAGSEALSLSTCENLLSQVAKKIEELQNEMKLYQSHNEHLKNLQQQYHQMLSKLQKDKDDFEAHKEKETNKLKSELEEEKRKIRTQRRRQNLSTVTKAEMKSSASAAKDKLCLDFQNVNKEAQSQIQRKVNLLASENGRLKDKLQVADQEKNSLKAMVKELEEQRIALLEKLEKIYELKGYPSLNELALSPASHFVMPMLIPAPSSPFQSDGAQLALESAHGDSLCMEAKNCKETAFDFGSTLNLSGTPAKSKEQTSEPSAVISATAVTCLSLDSTVATSSLGVCNKENYTPALRRNDSLQKEKLAHSQSSKTVRFAADIQTSQSDSSVLDSIGRTTVVGLQGEHVQSASDESAGQRMGELCISYKEISSDQKLCEVPLTEMPVKNDNFLDRISKVTKVGLITKEVLTNTSFKRPSADVLHWNGASQMSLHSDKSSSVNITTEDSKKNANQGLRLVSSLVGECEVARTECNEGSESDRCTSADIQATRCDQTDLESCHGSEQSQSCPNEEQIAEGTDKTYRKLVKELQHNEHTSSDINVSKNGDHSDWESYEEPGQGPLVCGAQCAKNTECSEVKSAEPGNECTSDISEGGTRHGSPNAEEAGNSLHEILQELGGHCSLQAPKAMSRCFLQDCQASHSVNRWKRPADLAVVSHLSADRKVSSLIKKYSQVCTSSEDTSGLPETTRARKSQSAQIQSSSLMRDHSLDKHNSRTWALDSNGHKMLLTVVSKEIDPFTQVIIYKFQNGDQKDLHPDGKVVYHYAKSQTVHTVYPCGQKEIKFVNGQVETHSGDGNVEVTYPDGTVRRIFSTGEEEQKTPDGIVARRLRDGTETIDYPNGQKEVRSELYRSRYYPNGTVKTVYVDGKQVTRYPNGRVRVKEADGTVRG